MKKEHVLVLVITLYFIVMFGITTFWFLPKRNISQSYTKLHFSNPLEKGEHDGIAYEISWHDNRIRMCATDRFRYDSPMCVTF